MTWKSGSWGKEAKERSKKRSEYFKNRYKYKCNIGLHIGLHNEGFGSKGELIALKILNNSILVRKSGYDLIWQDKKIEVKIATFKPIHKSKPTIQSWIFNIGRQKDKTDLFFLIGMNKEKNSIERMYLIPNQDMPNIKTLCIGKKSKRFIKFIIKRGEILHERISK